MRRGGRRAPRWVKKWLAARAPTTRPPHSKSIDEIAEEVLATVPEEAEPALHCIQRHDGHLVVGMRTIRGDIKDCAQVLSTLYVGKVEKEKSFAVKVKNAVYYPPEVYWVPIVRTATGERITEPDGTYDKAIHIMTPQGPRSALKTVEYVNDVSLVFPLIILTTPDTTKAGAVVPGKMVVSETDLKTLFLYGGAHGYGPERGDGQGKYVATITATVN